MYGYVYKFTLNNKIYIGKHKWSKGTLDESYWGGGIYWKSTLKKYGKDSVKREILEWCETKSDLSTREKFWIDKFNSRDKRFGYNLSVGGDGNPWIKGKPKTEEMKLKNRITHLELCKDESYRLKISIATRKAMAREDVKEKMKNRKLSDAQKQHLREINLGDKNPNWGITWTDERKTKLAKTRETSEAFKNMGIKISKASKGVKKSDAHCASLSVARKGKKIYTNGIETHFYFEGSQPEGYYKKRR